MLSVYSFALQCVYSDDECKVHKCVSTEGSMRRNHLLFGGLLCPHQCFSCYSFICL